MSKVVHLKASPAETRAARVRTLLKDRDKAEAEIAALLREQLDDLGEPKWLAWCEREFGWKRSTAYRHLNPSGAGKARADTATRRSMSQQLRHDHEQVDDDEPLDDDGPYLNDILTPSTKALIELGRLSRSESAASIISDLRKQYANKGVGVDAAFMDELVRLRNWLEEIIEGVEPLIVSCEVHHLKKDSQA